MILFTDGQMDKVKPVDPPFNFVEAGGIKRNLHHQIMWYLMKGNMSWQDKNITELKKKK